MSVGSQFWSQNSPGINGASEDFDRCGASLASGDINRDGFADLIWGCPVRTSERPIPPGRSTCCSDRGGLLLSSTTQRCGAAITVGFFNDDDFADVAYGCANSSSGAGLVWIEHGGSTFANFSFAGAIDQNDFGVPDSNESGDNFGHAVAAGDFNGDGRSELAVGAPNEDLTAGNNVGAVTVILFPLPDLDPIRTLFFHQDVAGILDVSELNDNFGFALAGSGATPLPGLTGQWGDDLSLWCRGASCSLTGTFTAINPSPEDTPHVTVRFYLSEDEDLDDADLLLDVMPVKPLDPGQSQVRKVNVTLPPGTYAIGRFVIAFVDADNIVEESNEANNIVVSDAID